MTKQVINIGNQSNDGTGDAIREAFQKVNSNFTELYQLNGISTGNLVLTTNLDGGGFTATNFLDPTAFQDLTTKIYVDKNRQVAALSDVSLTSVADGDMLMFDGSLSINTGASKPIWTAGRYLINVSNSASSNISIVKTGNSVQYSIKSGAITNSMVSSTASIAQSKLDLALATATSGSGTPGIALFDSSYFTVTSGWATLKSPGNNKYLTTDGTGVVTWIDKAAAVTYSNLTAGNYISGSTYNPGSPGVTWAVDATTAATAGKVVARDISGDIYVNSLNAASSISGASAYFPNNSYIYFKNTPAGSNLPIFGVDNSNDVIISSAGNYWRFVTTPGGTTRAYLTSNGDFYTYGDVTAYYTSDINLKTNVEKITGAVAKIMTLDGITFNWNDKAVDKNITKREAGVIAQQVIEVLPEAVTTRDNGNLAVKYEQLIPLLIESIKELKLEIEELKKQIK